MTRLADRIMKRLRARGRGRWVCTPKDFLDLGSRDAVDQALSPPRQGRPAPPGRPRPLRPAAHQRRDGTVRAPSTSTPHSPRSRGATASASCRTARRPPTASASPTRCRPGYVHRRRHAHLGHRRRHRPAPACGTPRHALGRTPGGPGSPKPSAGSAPTLPATHRVVVALKRRLRDAVKYDLSRNARDLPGWALPIARHIAGAGTAPA